MNDDRYRDVVESILGPRRDAPVDTFVDREAFELLQRGNESLQKTVDAQKETIEAQQSIIASLKQALASQDGTIRELHEVTALKDRTIAITEQLHRTTVRGFALQTAISAMNNGLGTPSACATGDMS